MEDGNWETADSMISAAMHGGGGGQRIADAAAYLAAVALLRGVETAGDAKQAARAMRYAAALNLPPKHRMPLVRDAIRRNMAVRNYG